MKAHRWKLMLLLFLALVATGCGKTDVVELDTHQKLVEVTSPATKDPEVVDPVIATPQPVKKLYQLDLSVRRHCLKVTKENPQTNWVNRNVMRSKDIRFTYSILDMKLDADGTIKTTRAAKTITCSNLNLNFRSAFLNERRVLVSDCEFPEPASDVLRTFSISPAVKNEDGSVTPIGAVESFQMFNGKLGKAILGKGGVLVQSFTELASTAQLMTTITYQVASTLGEENCDTVQE